MVLATTVFTISAEMALKCLEESSQYDWSVFNWLVLFYLFILLFYLFIYLYFWGDIGMQVRHNLKYTHLLPSKVFFFYKARK